MRVFQLTENLLPGDAISDEALALDTALRSLGYETKLFTAADRVGRGAPSPHRLTQSLREDDLLLFHFSTGSSLNDLFAACPCRRAIVYHNITPAEYFDPWDARLADRCRMGRDQLARIVPELDLAVADSEYNAAELKRLGCGRVFVLPVLFDARRVRTEPDDKMLKRLSDGKKNLLFVGRKAPNKRIEELMLAADYYAAGGRDVRLILCGDESLTRYCAALRELRDKLKAEIVWLGRVSESELAACYRAADAFLCLSAHEGFCVPLTESMRFRVPIVAAKSSAVGETLGDAGLLLEEATLPAIARALDAVLFDENIRAELLSAAEKRLAAFSPALVTAKLAAILRDLAD